MKRTGKRAKPNKRKGYVLKVTDKVIEWEPESHDRKPADEIFDRLLPKFGWSQDKTGHLEHVGIEPGDDAH